MKALLAEDTVLTPTSCCTVRKQEDQYLIYNTQTDELHLTPYSAYYVLRLCDGLATIGDIEDRLSRVVKSQKSHISNQLRPFLAALMERGILEKCDD